MQALYLRYVLYLHTKIGGKDDYCVCVQFVRDGLVVEDCPKLTAILSLHRSGLYCHQSFMLHRKIFCYLQLRNLGYFLNALLPGHFSQI